MHNFEAILIITFYMLFTVGVTGTLLLSTRFFQRFLKKKGRRYTPGDWLFHVLLVAICITLAFLLISFLVPFKP